MRTGIGIGISNMPGSSSVSLPFDDPGDLQNLLSWHRADMGITLGSTMRAAGTTPPAVTLTGTLTQAIPLWIDIPVGGARGTAEFRYSTNGGTSYSANTLTAASVALGATGITANFANATYSTDNIYKATIGTWSDQSGNSKNVSQATASLQHLYVGSSSNLNSQSAILCDATSGVLSASFSQTVKEIFFVATYPATTFSTFNALFQAIGGAPYCRGSSGAATWFADFTGTRYRDGVTTSTALSTANAKHFYRQAVTTPGATTGYRIGGDGGASREWRGEIAEIITLSAEISSAQLSQLHSYITNRYGITIS